MAIIRQPLLPIGGRYGHVIFYRLPCGLICRVLNPHTRKRILKDPRFAEFRKCSKRMAKASKIGSAIYRALPETFRQFWMYRAFVGEAMRMLKDQQMSGGEVMERMFKTYVEIWYVKAHSKEAEQTGPGRNAGTINRANAVAVNIRWKEYHEKIQLRKRATAVMAIFNKPGQFTMPRTADVFNKPIYAERIDLPETWCWICSCRRADLYIIATGLYRSVTTIPRQLSFVSYI